MVKVDLPTILLVLFIYKQCLINNVSPRIVFYAPATFWRGHNIKQICPCTYVRLSIVGLTVSCNSRRKNAGTLILSMNTCWHEFDMLEWLRVQSRSHLGVKGQFFIKHTFGGHIYVTDTDQFLGTLCTFINLSLYVHDGNYGSCRPVMTKYIMTKLHNTS